MSRGWSCRDAGQHGANPGHPAKSGMGGNPSYMLQTFLNFTLYMLLMHFQQQVSGGNRTGYSPRALPASIINFAPSRRYFSSAAASTPLRNDGVFCSSLLLKNQHGILSNTQTTKTHQFLASSTQTASCEQNDQQTALKNWLFKQLTSYFLTGNLEQSQPINACLRNCSSFYAY